jgi:colanic acid biosynthesis glycosyl transferase WcaI
MAVIFVNRFFYPDHSATSQILTDLALDLANEDDPITVITSRQLYDDRTVVLPSTELINGVNVVRVATTGFGRKTILGRTLDYCTFYLTASIAVYLRARRGDIIIVKTDPPMLSVVIAPVAWIKSAILVNWLQDLYPEVAEKLGVGRGWVATAGYGLLRKLRDQSLAAATMNVAISESMANRISNGGIAPSRICVIDNWADGSAIKPLRDQVNSLKAEWGLQDDFIVGYSGNLGQAHDHAAIVDAIEILRVDQQLQNTHSSNIRIRWLFIGGGSGFDTLKKEVKRRGLSAAMFKPYQPREILSLSLSVSDIHLISLRPELEGLITPSKFYGIAAAGKASIFIGSIDGDISRFLEGSEAGFSVAQDDGAGLANAIIRLANDPAECERMGKNARQLFDERFDKKIAIARWKTVLKKVKLAQDER